MHVIFLRNRFFYEFNCFKYLQHQKNDDTLKLYKIVNEANTETKIGNFTIIANESGNKKIVYRSLVNCGNDFSNLSKRLIKFQILSFISPLEKILFSLKEL